MLLGFAGEVSLLTDVAVFVTLSTLTLTGISTADDAFCDMCFQFNLLASARKLSYSYPWKHFRSNVNKQR